ncbi:MAG: DNA gyrase subunit A [Candidatus Rokubacteria bacterium RIFCSPLOWO2_02_FULL_72_37]|nr:MAG: DNA gyrase subunit A [Candidatus Rokubacteria bacterium RIFCSPLOWO2_02_FULL_72_37]
MPNERQVPVPIEEEMRKSYLDYAMSVIVGRALPDIRDGLKPVHRRVLYAMQELGLTWNRAYKKSARVVGEVLGKYHPHGDSPVYEALVRMVQEFSLRYPLVDGQGNFGSIDGDPPAAMRYTETRLAKIAHEMLADIDKDTVDFAPNFDESLREPVVLPTRVPNLLVNGSSGIAVGMATNIPPHNLAEIVDGLVALIDRPETPIEHLMKIVAGPDFPTAGYIYGTGGIREAYTTGRGTITLRAKAHAEKMRGGREAIIITELPYQVNKASLIEKIAELKSAKKVDGISEIRDESSREGIRVVLELGRGEIPQIVMNQLYKHTQMQTTFGVIMLALVDRRPQIVNLKEMLEAFVRFRREIVTRRTRFDLARAEERAHILAGLRKAVEQLDLVIRLIRQAESPDAARDALMTRLDLSEIQARAILDMRLQRLTQLERHKVVEEHEQTLALIEELKGILASDAKLMGIIRQELLAIKEEYGDARRTEILTETTELTIEDLLADEEMVVTVTRSGYIKRTHVEAYRSQRRGGKGVTGMETKEEDVVEDLFVASTHAYLLFFTNLGKVHWLKVHEIPEGGRPAKGKAMVNLLALGEGERVATCVPVRDFAAGGYVLFSTKQGKVKKTELDAYAHPRAGGIQAIGLEERDEVMTARRTDGQREVMIATRRGMIIRFGEDQVRAMGRGAAGVKGIELEEDDAVIAADVLQEGAQILTVTERGFGKRTPLEEYRLQGRGGKGIIDIKTGGRNGGVVGMLQVRAGDDVLVVTTKGKMIRVPADEVSSQGRNTMGVRIIDIEADDRVGSIARVGAEQAPVEAP